MSTTMWTDAMAKRLLELLAILKLTALASQVERRFVEAGHREALTVLLEVVEHEVQARHGRRVERLLRESKLPPGKTFATLDDKRLPRTLVDQAHALGQGGFVERADNVLCFGLPGTGKSHVASAIGHALVQTGRSVLFVPTYQLVQGLLVAKRNLDLPRALRKLDGYDVLILDDIGYVQQNAEEIEVLFTLMAERYERRSMLITSNLVFSDWERIFKNPMTTAAAIDRVVHHSVILEFDVPSFRTEEARRRGRTSNGAGAGDAASSSGETEPA